MTFSHHNFIWRSTFIKKLIRQSITKQYWTPCRSNLWTFNNLNLSLVETSANLRSQFPHHFTGMVGNWYNNTRQGRRKVWKSRGPSSNVVVMIYPSGFDRVNWSAKSGGRGIDRTHGTKRKKKKKKKKKKRFLLHNKRAQWSI